MSSISEKLAEGLSKAKNLNKVILESCHLTKDLIGQMKIDSSNVKELDLSSNQLGDCGNELASFLKGFISLRSLKLARNRITHKTLECYDLNFTNLRKVLTQPCSQTPFLPSLFDSKPKKMLEFISKHWDRINGNNLAEKSLVPRILYRKSSNKVCFDFLKMNFNLNII